MTRRISLVRLGALTRRRAMACFTAAAGMPAFAARPACAGLVIDSVLRFVQPVRIALPDFLASSPADADPARAISQIITANLKRTEKFEPIDQATFIEKITNFDKLPRFADWRAINADALVTGRVTRPPDGRLLVAFRLWDVSASVQPLGQTYIGTPDNLRPRIANIISDAIYEFVTGEKGNFDASNSP
jgi:TolB protein